MLLDFWKVSFFNAVDGRCMLDNLEEEEEEIAALIVARQEYGGIP